MIRSVGTAAFAAALIAATSALCPRAGWNAAAQTFTDMAREDKIVHGPADDPIMTAAIHKGQATLDDFLRVASAPGRDQTDFSVKVGFRTPDRRTEFIWIKNFEPSGSGFSGQVANTPDDVPGIKEGDTVEFTRSRIIDWTYFDHDEMKGNFTACALLAHQSAADIAEFTAEYHKDCAKDLPAAFAGAAKR